jgi:hypothetical protein
MSNNMDGREQFLFNVREPSAIQQYSTVDVDSQVEKKRRDVELVSWGNEPITTILGSYNRIRDITILYSVLWSGRGVGKL